MAHEGLTRGLTFEYFFNFPAQLFVVMLLFIVCARYLIVDGENNFQVALGLPLLWVRVVGNTVVRLMNVLGGRLGGRGVP